MSSFYGNMKNNSRASFIFDKIYPSRVAMEKALYEDTEENNSSVIKGDGIFINRYVLIDYHYILADDVKDSNLIDKYFLEIKDSKLITPVNYSSFYIKTENEGYKRPSSYIAGEKYYQRKTYVDRYRLEEDSTSLMADELFEEHRHADWEAYRATYDCTVWMKIYADNKERYILVAELDAKAPVLEFIDDAPSCYNGSGHFDTRASTDLNYIYYLPKNWDMVVNKFNPNDSYYKRVEGLNENENIEGKNYYELIDNNEYQLTNDTTAQVNKDYYILDMSGDNYWYYQNNKESNDAWFEDYIQTEDIEIQPNKQYYQVTFNELQVPAGRIIKNNHYYIKVQKEENNYEYIATNDLTARENVIYYQMNTPVLIDSPSIGEDINNFKDNGILIYEPNIQKKSFNDQVQYPYFNQAGFNKRVSTHVDEVGQGVFLNKVPSAQTYPKHIFKHAGGITQTTFLPNKYFIYNGPKEKVGENDSYNRDCAYYIGTGNPTSYEYVPLVLVKNQNDNNTEWIYKPGKPLNENQFYYYDSNLINKYYFTKATNWEKGQAYYEITWEFDTNGNKLTSHEDDTYRLDIYLPELGNTVADIYDIIYGAPIIQNSKTDGYNNIIGYCSNEQFQSFIVPIGYCSQTEFNDYAKNSNGNYCCNVGENNRFNLTDEQLAAVKEQGYDETTGHTIPVYERVGDYWANNWIFGLDDEQFNSLSPEPYPGVYDIPVYLKNGSNVRPYNDERIQSIITPPYDNFTEDENVSVGWALTLLKRYLSELRYLAYGANSNKIGDGIGLQSDWTLEDDKGFGYIYHKPIVITNYTVTSDKFIIADKKYYREDVENGEIIYIPVTDYYRRLGAADYANKYFYQSEKKQYQLIDAEHANQAIESGSILMKLNTNGDYVPLDGSEFKNLYYCNENDVDYVEINNQQHNLTDLMNHYYQIDNLYNSSNINFFDYLYKKDNENNTYVRIESSDLIGKYYKSDPNINDLTPINENNLPDLNNKPKIYVEIINGQDSISYNLYDYEGYFLQVPKKYKLINSEYYEENRIKYKYKTTPEYPDDYEVIEPNDYVYISSSEGYVNCNLYYYTTFYQYYFITLTNYSITRPKYKIENFNGEFYETTFAPDSSESSVVKKVTINDFKGKYYTDYDDSIQRSVYVEITDNGYVEITNENYQDLVTTNRIKNLYIKIEENYYPLFDDNNYYLTLNLYYKDPINNEFYQIDSSFNKNNLIDNQYQVYKQNNSDPNTYEEYYYQGCYIKNLNNVNCDLIYEKKPAEEGISVGSQIDLLSYPLYELPHTFTNNIESNKDIYIRCSEESDYDPETNIYYSLEGSRYVPAYYATYTDYISHIVSGNEKGNVAYNNGYQIIIDTTEENGNKTTIIKQRNYYCSARTSDTGITLCRTFEDPESTTYSLITSSEPNEDGSLQSFINMYSSSIEDNNYLNNIYTLNEHYDNDILVQEYTPIINNQEEEINDPNGFLGYYFKRNNYFRKAIQSFCIIIDNSNDLTNDAPSLEDKNILSINDMTVTDGLISLSRAEIETMLNITLNQNYNVKYDNFSIRSNWTPTPLNDNEYIETGFYYGALNTKYTKFSLTEEEFNKNKTNYYIRESVPIEQTDYEIHNIWNSVAEEKISLGL